MVKDFVWEEVTYEGRPNRNKGAADVRLGKSVKECTVANCLYIPARYAKELCWSSGQRVTLFRSGSMYALKARSGGIEVLRGSTKNGKSSALKLTSINMVTHMGLPVDLIKGDEPILFDAWTDTTGEGTLIFKLKKESGE